MSVDYLPGYAAAARRAEVWTQETAPAPKPLTAAEQAQQRLRAENGRELGAAVDAAAASAGGVSVLHDLVPPGRMTTLDHVVIGPAGVTVIDAKTWPGRMSVGDVVIGRRKYGRRGPIEGVRAQQREIVRALAAAGRSEVPVTAAACFVGQSMVRDLQEVEGVRVGGMSSVLLWALRDGPYDLDDVYVLQMTLQRSFIVRGAVAQASEARPAGRAPVITLPRPSAAVSRARLSAPALKPTLALLAAVAVLAALLLLVAGPSGPSRVSRSELTTHRIALRAGAITAAGGAVRGPRVSAAGSGWRLTYKRGAHCVVRMLVGAGGGSLSMPAVTATRCA